MTAGSRTKAIFDLFAAHRELSALEWSEFLRAMRAMVVCAVCALVTGLAAWLAANAAVVFAFKDDPLRALAAVTALNSVIAAVGVLQAWRLMRRPFFALTKRETSRDMQTVLKAFA